MKNIVWIVIAFLLAALNGDTALFMGFMKWGLMAGACIGAIVFVVHIVRMPFTRR